MAQDWRQMGRGDFDESAPLALVDERAARAGTRVPATPDAYGTAALFGDEVRPIRRTVPRRAPSTEPQSDALF
ncbi:hypothetical protein [Streptomyces noursei]|uniref:hypothetical protein n=1 Tax=Streptomyces noursei TaxID=1971 RepID=UPI00167606D3|nr:hypothetical protein [Streptomyces noursei]MCZ1014402.1 hypothetical protein [Streptomyces noursei]GGW94748.1 hypothetical protein GCM10010341_14880 [Streptomyces noursei]